MASCAPAGLELGIEVHGISWSGGPVFQDLLTVLGCFLTVWELTAMCSASCNPFDCKLQPFRLQLVCIASSQQFDVQAKPLSSECNPWC